MSLTEEQVIEALGGVRDPESGIAMLELGMVRTVRTRRGRVEITLALPTAGSSSRTELVARVRDAVGALRSVKAVAVETTVMSPEALDEWRARTSAPVAGATPAAPAPPAQADAHGHSHGGHGAAPLGHEQGRANPFGPHSTTRVIGITSGKGGVGKSSVTVNLAVSLVPRRVSRRCPRR